MCNLTKQAFAKALLTLKLSDCICEICCSTIKQILQNKCMGIGFVSANKRRSYNSAFMRLPMNDCDFKPPNYKLMSAVEKHFVVVAQQWAEMSGLAQDRAIAFIL